MPAATHTKAAEAHETAANAHKAASALHGKGDHKAGLEQSEKAKKLSDGAHSACCSANDKSKAAAH
jgi:hypothetical protein